MSPVTLSSAVVAALIVSGVVGQSTYPATPLASKRFSYPTGVPYKADSDVGLIRGEQAGYNQCNSTTEGQTSLCQTGFINSIDDFCLWAPSKINSTIADTEGEEVAWCTKPGRGTRLIPANALQGVQFMKTPDYIQVVGFIDQAMINIQTGDSGGELDPHGADLRGNPMGGLLYTQQFNTPSGQWTQVIEWHNFMGGEAFCFKACDPAGAHAADYCQHVFDRIGCAYNAPNNAQKGVFESCLGDNQDFPGVYTVNGQAVTYSQPPESLGPIMSLPYQPRVPPSSSCTQFTSASLYTAIASVQASATGTSSSASASVTGSGTSSRGNTKPSGSQSGAGAQTTGNGNGASAGAVIGMTGVSFAGIVLSALLFS
ncbi:hypothetical protein E1B28_010723 [Marasmius oreades]|uniref:Macrofage activating glycoprotein n=1 Tax=Marasmius oreades TaxID=181124 RepID=A0A9P7RSR7_9AGAR|nr:uncharacterized protein E1B28_010723 [Marasmius oreades]KAG7089010.1 hypothetical protein E1B28_010723 [Marasmius oreades]